MYSLIYRFCSFFPGVKLFRSAILVAILLYYFAAISSISASERTAWFSDVPLIERVTVDTQLSFAFDSPSGRILVLLLQTQETDMEFLSSYRDTLSALGWTKHHGQYVKGDEILKLEKSQLERKSLWRLTIIPLSANMLEFR